MGHSVSKKGERQAILVGAQGSGKTKLLYSLLLNSDNWDPDPTYAFNYEEIQVSGQRMGVWDLGGSEVCRPLWSTIYKSVKMHGIILVVDAAEQETHFIQSRQMLHFLANEDELRYCTLIIVVNRKNEEQKGGQPKGKQDDLIQEIQSRLEVEELPKTLDFSDKHIFVESAKNKEAAQQIFKKAAQRVHSVI